MNMLRPIWPTTYIPAPPIPRWFARRLMHIGGKNPFGEPNYRVIWAMDATMFRNGNPDARAYPNPNDTNLGYACFWLQRWAAPEFFNKIQWEALRYGKDGSGKTVDHLGPFPARGDYIGVLPLMKDDGDMPYEMIPLTQALLDEIEPMLAPGSQKTVNMGVLEAQDRLKRAKSAAKTNEILEERRAHYRTNAAKINTRASRRFVGLLEGKVSTAEHERVSSLPVRKYTDETGAVHSLWADHAGNGNAQIDFTMP